MRGTVRSTAEQGGSAAGTAAADVRPTRVHSALAGWAGIAALLACGIVLDVSSMFPGWIAIWPLAAAAAVVVAGHSGRRWGVDALLSTRPAAFIGDISYALYLVHWPLLVLAQVLQVHMLTRRRQLPTPPTPLLPSARLA